MSSLTVALGPLTPVVLVLVTGIPVGRTATIHLELVGAGGDVVVPNGCLRTTDGLTCHVRGGQLLTLRVVHPSPSVR